MDDVRAHEGDPVKPPGDAAGLPAPGAGIHLGKLWDSAVGRVAAVATYIVGTVYVSGAAVIAGRLYRRDVPITAVIGQFPKSFLLTAGFEEVALPALVLMAVGWLINAKVCFTGDPSLGAISRGSSDETTGDDGVVASTLRRLSIPVGLALVVAVADLLIGDGYKRVVYFSKARQFGVTAVLVALSIFLLLEIRGKVLRDVVPRFDGKDRSHAGYLFGALTTFPILLVLAISIGTAFPFPNVAFCGPQIGAHVGNLVVQSSDTAYILETPPQVNGRNQPAILQILPAASLVSVTVDGACPQ